jgi:predicted glycosyltransferase
LLRDFVKPAPPPRRWVRGRSRRKRALYISSPIGLGHAQRDVAIAGELRKLHPDLEIDWLAQDPVTRVLEARGERIHPASAWLANESAHIESESAEHDLHCFQAIRRMDEILLANLMVFHDLVREEHYDLWIGDEAWELDYYLHENPEHKQATYVWLTDFVGWLPMPDGGEREAFVAADDNAEMIEHIARFPRVRDRAIFVGNPDDIVPDSFGPELPLIGDWTREHYAFAGYATGFDPSDLADRQALRQELGYRPDEQACVVTVGGSGVGGHLLRRVIEAFPEAKRRVPALRMVVVTGPRIDLGTLPRYDGLELRAYVHELYRHLAACDLAVVQGGLTTWHGADGEPAAVPVPPAAPPLRAELPRRPTAWTATGRAGGWTTPPATPTPSPPESAAPSTTGRWRPTAPPGPPASLPNSCEQLRSGWRRRLPAAGSVLRPIPATRRRSRPRRRPQRSPRSDRSARARAAPGARSALAGP